MGLETFTGKVSDLVETNPPGTDPKSQGDDHLRGIKKTIIGQAVKTQVGQHATGSENHFFDGSVANEITLKRGTVDAPGAELIKALNGVLSFPNQGQSLTDNGYVKLPGGLIIQWGYAPPIGLATQVITFPVPFQQFRSVACQRVGTSTTTVQTGQIISSDLTSFSYFGLFSPVTPTPAVFTGDTTNEFFWIAIGY